MSFADEPLIVSLPPRPSITFTPTSPVRMSLLLEPRMFSFNNPAGACRTCDGLGVQQFFDPDRVAANPHLSLAGGAIRGWDRRNAYYFQLIQCLAGHYKFDIEKPLKSLSKKLRKIILYGSGKETIEFSYFDGRGGPLMRGLPSLEWHVK